MGLLRADRITGLGGANAITGSTQFDGDLHYQGNFLAIGDSDDFNLGSGDFTIEAWIYANAFDAFEGIIGQWPASGANANNSWVLEVVGGDLEFYYCHSGATLVGPIQGGSLSKNEWTHVMATRSGNTMYMFINGTAHNNSGQSVTHTFNDSTYDVTIGGYVATAAMWSGNISNVRVIKGTALHTSNFTVPTSQLVKTSDTVLLACQSAANILKEETGKIIVARRNNTNGAFPSASKFTPNSPVGFSTTSDVGSQYGSNFDGFGSFATSTYMVPPGGNTRERGRGRGVLGGGFNGVSPNNHNVISYVEVQSGGIFKDFGDLTLARSYFPAGQTSSSTRGIFAGGYGGGGGYNTIDFITIANTGNAIDFGDISVAKFGQGGLSNQTRAVFGGNSTAPFDNIIEFVTIATTGNAQDFGDIVEARGLLAGASSSTRGVLGGGRNNTPSSNTLKNTMEYVTFSTTGNTQDFGDLQALRYGHTGFSSPTRGIYAGGYLTPGQTATIDYFTIATLGNSLDFGDLTTNNGYCGSVTNSIRGAVTINDAPNYYNTIEYITIATLGDAQDFGDADVGSSKGHGDFPACASDSHGGVA